MVFDFPSCLRPVVPACLAAVVLTAAGCDTFTQDMQSMGSNLVPVTPEQAARWMVDPNDPDNRRKGTVLISNSPFGGADPYLAVYRDRVTHEADPLVKAASITALGRWGEPSDVPAIAACLENENVQVRWEAAKALQRLHNRAAVSPLLQVLRDPDEDPDVQVAAATALGQYAEDRVFQSLVGALDTPQLSVNEAARQSLCTLTGQELGLDPEPWLKWYNGVDDPFAGRKEFLFPTYHRKESFLEKLAFWSSPTFEQPAPPAGLEPEGGHRTYDDSDEPGDDETGG